MDEEETIKEQEYISPPFDFQQTIQAIEGTAFEIILDSIKNGKQLNDMSKEFSKVSALVYQKSMNNDYKPFLFQYFQNKIIEFTEYYSSGKLKNKMGKELLSEFLSQWEKTRLLIYWMKRIFGYLDTAYLNSIDTEENEERKTLSMVGLKIFFTNIFKKFCKHVISQIFNEIESERDGNLVDWDRIQKVISCYRSIGVKKGKILKEGNEINWVGEENLQYYTNLFEPKYIEHTVEYYKKHSSIWFSKQSVPEYVNTVINAFKHEEDKILKFLDKTTLSKLNEKLVSELIAAYDKKLVERENSGCSEMYKNKKLEELKNMYFLFSRNPASFNSMIEVMKPYIKNRAENISKNEDLQKDPVKFINEFILLKNEFDHMLLYCFDKNPLFSNAIDLSISLVVRESAVFPQYLANYIDELFRVSIKGRQNQQEELLNSIMFFVTCIIQKDVFLNFYSKLLSNRLLNDTSLSKEAENALINKLTVECGFNNVNKLNQMVEDISKSTILQNDFKNIPTNKSNELNVKVLSTANWPEQSIFRFTMPQIISTMMSKYELFYKSKEPRRNLFWLFHQGNCEIKTNHLSKSYTLISTAIQFSILDIFNHKDEISYSELKSMLQLSVEDIQNNLKFLTVPTRPIISKENPKTPAFSENEKISLNKKFSLGTLKVVLIPQATKAQAGPVKMEEIEIQINNERGNILDCIIVRIMKGRKSEVYISLVSEVIHQCILFKPDPSLIKQRIESLVEREFLKRDSANRNLYVYVP